jgi:putative copper export protein
MGRLQGIVAAAALAAACAWFVLTAGEMAGDARAALNGAVLEAALGTVFGMGFVLRAAALLLLAAALAWRAPRLALAMAGIALVSPALSSHAAASSPAHFAVVGIVIDAGHLLTAGFWIGGLALLAAAFARGTAKADLLLILSLFSEWAMVAVLLLVMTGLLNAALALLGGPGPASPSYLTVLGLKLAGVAAMLGLAVWNRFGLMGRFTESGAAARLKRNVALELGIGIAVIALAGLLGQLSPTSG